MKTERITVREAGPSDLDTVFNLMCQYYGRALPYEAVASQVFHLDPLVFRAWVAYDEDAPVGLTSLQLRSLRWNDRELRAGYWGNLYVRPEYRKHMVYPRLVFAMFKEGRASGVDIIYSAIRRPELAEAHRKLGFHQVGTLPVLIKPVRPFALLVKHKSLGGGLLHLGRILDRLYVLESTFRRICTRSYAVNVDAARTSEAGASVLEMLNRSGAGRISRKWKQEDFNGRFQTTIDGQPYEILTAGNEGAIDAALLCCRASRGNNINVLVILDILFSPGKEKVLEALLVEAGKRANYLGCDCILFLDGIGGTIRSILQKLGYRTTSEIYHMLVWPKERFPEAAPVSDLANWRFAFSDHDAF